MTDTYNDELNDALLWTRATVPQVRAAMRPLAVLEQQLGEFTDEVSSLRAAYDAGANIARRHPGAARPFEPDAAAAGLQGEALRQAAIVLLGAEIRRGLLSFRVAGLKPAASEAKLAAALKLRADAATQQGLEELQQALQRRGRRLSESDIYLAAWDEGLRHAGADAARCTEATGWDNNGFIRLIVSWGRAVGARARSEQDPRH